MKKQKLLGAIVLGSIGVLANPVWSHDGSRPGGSAAREDQTVPPSARSQGDMGLSAREVMAIEISLDKQGFHPGEIDGVLDNQTEQAIAGFQKQNNLPVTGNAG